MVKARKSQKIKTRISLTEKQLSKAKQIAMQSLADDPTIFDLPESKRTVDDVTNDQYNFMPLVTPDEFIALNRNMASDFNEEFIGRSTIS